MNKKTKGIAIVIVCILVAVFIGFGVKPFLTSDIPETDNIPEPTPSETILPDYYPFTSEKLKEAYDENNDVTGWLTIEDCEIDNRVFIGKDNDEYLRRNERGEYDIWGCYFLDYENVNDGYYLPDRVSVIYGHSWGDSADDKKFSKLKLYRDREFALSHQIINFSLLYNKLQRQIFAVSNMPVTIYYIEANPSDEDYQYRLNYMIEHSFVDFGVDVSADDQVLLLSTCTSNDNVRFVVAAKLLNNEKPEN